MQDVFTTKPARFTFVERESINNKLVAALRTRPSRACEAVGNFLTLAHVVI